MKNIILTKEELFSQKTDIGGRDLIVGFNEPKFKYSSKNIEEADLDSKLSARFVTYFLPAIKIAQDQKIRPRIYIVSGLNLAFLYNAFSEKERKIMLIDNNLKFDFLKSFIEKFFPETFSIVEFVVSQDILKIPEEKILKIWSLVEQQFPNETLEIKFALCKFIKPRYFNSQEYSFKEIEEFISKNKFQFENSVKYAVSHIFIFADFNFDGNYIHNPLGYASVGGQQEIIFNKLRRLVFKTLKNNAEIFFERPVIIKDNMQINFISQLPPAYNGSFKSTGVRKKTTTNEVTYENQRELDFYDQDKKMKEELDFLYDNFVSRKEYKAFWDSYRQRYFQLKARYREAYKLEEDF